MTTAKTSQETPPFSPRAAEKKRRDRRQVMFLLGFVTVTVAAMTWYDLALRDYTYVHRAPAAGHYITSPVEAEALPDDYSGISVWQGRLVATPDGNFEREGDYPVPVTFAQREVNLIVALDNLPATEGQTPLVQALQNIARGWEARNNMVVDIILDVRNMDANGNDLLAFINKLKEDTALNYRVGLIVDPTANSGPVSGDDEKTRYDLLSKLSALYIYLPAENALETIADANAYLFPYNIFVPHGHPPDAEIAKETEKSKYFREFITEATPNDDKGSKAP